MLDPMSQPVILPLYSSLQLQSTLNPNAAEKKGVWPQEIISLICLGSALGSPRRSLKMLPGRGMSELLP